MGKIVNADDFINIAHIREIKDTKECERLLVEIIHRFINGEPITFILKKMKISFSKFNAMLNTFPKYLDIYEDAKVYHKAKIKGDLEATALTKAKSGNVSMIQFLLERLYPEEYEKKINIKQNIIDTSSRPPGFDEFIEAQIEDKRKADED